MSGCRHRQVQEKVETRARGCDGSKGAEQVPPKHQICLSVMIAVDPIYWNYLFDIKIYIVVDIITSVITK